MPSIPQSLLWISLVVLWLFVLVPMLVSKRDNVRRTSDVALATRVLNSGRNARLRRPRASAGHNSDPHWQPAGEYDAEIADDLDDAEHNEADEPSRRRAVVLAAAVEEAAESPYLDVDVVDEDSGA
ncbi:MAG: gephyrin-like molybdotransferase receptor GlpR, partial [Mycobacterium sp.]